VKTYIDLFYDLAQDAKSQGRYEYAMGLESAGNAVNNLGHGISPLVYLPKVRDILLYNSEQSWSSDEMKEAYSDAIELIDSELAALQDK
jgi:hypothetical protein